jgi:hypothetical protein
MGLSHRLRGMQCLPNDRQREIIQNGLSCSRRRDVSGARRRTPPQPVKPRGLPASQPTDAKRGFRTGRMEPLNGLFPAAARASRAIVFVSIVDVAFV